MLLAIDTSAGTSVALVDLDGQPLQQHASADTRRHAELLGTFLADIPVAHITAVVVGVGPGPFTGLRVGIAAARGFAWGAQRPLWPVLSHDAIAAARYGEGASGPLRVVTDARRREYFQSSYADVVDGVPQRSSGPEIVATVDVENELASTVDAVALAGVALARQAAGLDWEPAAAVYLRSPDVSEPKPKRGGQ